MIKINVNGNRSDIAGYISYYSSKEIAPLLEIDEKDIVYESAVVDYFAFALMNGQSRRFSVKRLNHDQRCTAHRSADQHERLTGRCRAKRTV